MNYELAKELKDAGFPQEGNHYCPHQGCFLICVPTLEELIEACGEEFFGLQRQDGAWSAWMKFPDALVEKDAATPREAVARLWLALNKK